MWGVVPTPGLEAAQKDGVCEDEEEEEEEVTTNVKKLRSLPTLSSTVPVWSAAARRAPLRKYMSVLYGEIRYLTSSKL